MQLLRNHSCSVPQVGFKQIFIVVTQLPGCLPCIIFDFHLNVYLIVKLYYSYKIEQLTKMKIKN